MIQQEFAARVAEIVKEDPSAIGLAVGGSWLANEIDEFSDLDLVLITQHKIAGDKAQMLAYAGKFGKLLSGFTGEHVGEPRLLICLYDDPLLHVDIKFLTLEEFGLRIETPYILADTDDQLQHSLDTSTATFPYPDYQWIEDRFWTWVHYALLKIGRGEYFETINFFSDIRRMVLGPLLHIKNGNLPRGVRKLETQIDRKELDRLKLTLATYDRLSLLVALENCTRLYQDLRKELFADNILRQTKTEERVIAYFQEIKKE